MFGRLFNDFFTFDESQKFGSPTYTPPMDIVEKQDSYLVIVEVPGTSKDNLKVTFHGNVLNVEGYRPRLPEEEQTDKFHHSEIYFGPFKRSIEFPQGTVSLQGIDSYYQQGFLYISIPKKVVRKIEIKVED